MTDLLPGISLRHVDTARVRTGVLVDDRTEGEAVVLVHGNVSSSVFWQETMLGLPEGFRAIAPDLRGFGETEPAPVDATRGLGDFADDVLALLDALSIERAHLVGWSMGGAIVLQLLAQSGSADLVSKVVLDAPVVDWNDVLTHHAREHKVPGPVAVSYTHLTLPTSDLV